MGFMAGQTLTVAGWRVYDRQFGGRRNVLVAFQAQIGTWREQQ